jgi:hypothetical protein
MIKFDVNKIRFETYWVKSLTTAMGGSISILDEDLSTSDREVYHRITVPLPVVRHFQTKHKTMKYIRPCLVAITYYENRAIALERHPAGCMGERESYGEQWYSDSERNFDVKIRPLLEKGDKEWYFDGRFIFNFDKLTAADAVRKGDFLSKDGRFRCVDVDAIGLHKLHDRSKLRPADRTCLAYVAQNGQFAVSPPIWKDARGVGKAKIKGVRGRNNEGERDFAFDSVDDHCAVNISFALRAASKLSEEFGFEAIEPLNLPGLMVRLNTVNLPKVPSEVKDTFDSGMKFTHALAWLLGFARRCHNLDTYASIRLLLKYLTSNGLFLKSAFDPTNIFKAGHSIETIPVLSKKEAAEANISLDERLAVLQNQRNRRFGWDGTDGNVVGGVLHNDDDD